ncbi:PEP-CTERM domain protein [Bradyrhizobium sp. WSM3983]|uniref:PEP-CTERM domain protein n=1 Tax=Bradyrhizobium sp. WSM3983 TaxID=1038867 RepID=UPI000488F00E|nr:PEP-CTERM domain protein [Bradyrhizobium sp. WSM3983]
MKNIGIPILVALIALTMPALTVPAAMASVVTFDIRGQATYTADNSTQSFSGTIGVDTATGSVTAFDVQIPFFSDFTTAGIPFGPIIFDEIFFFPDYLVGSGHRYDFPGGIVAFEMIELLFRITTPGSLVGFSGGTIDGGDVYTNNGNSYTNFSGTISAVPEASTWAMIMLGFCGLGLMAYQNRNRAELPA